MDYLLSKVKRYAIISRVITIALITTCAVLPNHEGDKFTPPIEKDEYSWVDRFLMWLLDGFYQWDSRYFQYIARHGYTTIESLAFFPGYPLCIQALSATLLRPLTWFLHVDVVLLISGILISNVAFVGAAMALYRLGVVCMGHTNVVYYAALLFCFNPASVFFSVCYSESLFALCTFLALESLLKRHYFTSALLFALSSAVRSNGTANAAFLLWPLGLRALHALYNTTLDWSVRLLDVALHGVAILVYAVLCVLPFAAYQRISYEWLCLHDDKGETLPGAKLYMTELVSWFSERVLNYRDVLKSDVVYLQSKSYSVLGHHSHVQQLLRSILHNANKVTEKVVNKSKEAGLHMHLDEVQLLNQSIPLGVSPGADKSEAVLPYCAPLWCNHTLPLVYSQVQQRWDVGFLEYFQLRKVPLFLLAAPTVFLVVLAVVDYVNRMNWPRHKHAKSGEPYTAVFSGNQIEDVRHPDPYSVTHSRPALVTENTISFLVHAVFLTLSGVFVFNVEVLTRVLFSASPVLPWFCALCLCDWRFQRYAMSATEPPEGSADFPNGTRLSRPRKEEASLKERVLRSEEVLFNMVHNFSKQNWLQQFVIGYFVGYFLIGIYAHANGLPWT